MLTQCSAPVEGIGGEAFKNPPVEATVEQPQDFVLGSSEQPSVNPSQELPDEDQKCPPEAPPINFPEQLKGTCTPFHSAGLKYMYRSGHRSP